MSVSIRYFRVDRSKSIDPGKNEKQTWEITEQEAQGLTEKELITKCFTEVDGVTVEIPSTILNDVDRTAKLRIHHGLKKRAEPI